MCMPIETTIAVSPLTAVQHTVTVMQLNGSDLVELLSLYCQPHTRWSTQVFCPVSVTLNQ